MIKFTWKVPNTPIFKESQAKNYFAQNKPLLFATIMPILQSGVVSNTPVGAMGVLRKSFVIKYGDKSELTSDTEYAAAVNDGRRAKPVSAEADHSITKWLRLSTRGQAFMAALRGSYPNVKEKALLRSALFILKRAKKKRATPGQHFFEAGLKSVEVVLEAAYKRILAKIAAGMNP